MKKIRIILFLLCLFLFPACVSAETFTSISDAGAYVREELRKRSDNITLTYVSDEKVPRDKLANKAINTREQIITEAFRHTGVGMEGDYLRYSIQTTMMSGEITGWTENGYTVNVTYKPKYFITLDKEWKTTTYAKHILRALNLSGKSDYEKIKIIYDWITENIRYDAEEAPYASSGGRNKEAYTAYGAIVLRLATCQGYSSLMYRLCNDAGIDCRMVRGDVATNKGWILHAWNAVKLEGAYYYCDPTWDAELVRLGMAPLYFLLSKMQDHDPDIIPAPIATSDYRPPVRLTVQGGMGSGVYRQGDEIKIRADVIDGKAFVKWEGAAEFVRSGKTNKTAYIKITKDTSIRAKTKYIPANVTGKHRIQLSKGRCLCIRKKSASVGTDTKRGKNTVFGFERTGGRYRIRAYTGKYLSAKGTGLIFTSKKNATKWTIVRCGKKYRLIAGTKALDTNLKMSEDRNLKTQRITLKRCAYSEGEQYAKTTGHGRSTGHICLLDGYRRIRRYFLEC